MMKKMKRECREKLESLRFKEMRVGRSLHMGEGGYFCFVLCYLVLIRD